jgi:1-deoxy-D-xylulose-5-phosphate synthase
MVAAASVAAERLAERGIDTTLWDVRSCQPLDEDMIADAARHERVLTFEDGVREGGIGMSIADRIHQLVAPGPQVEVCGVPVKFIPQAKPDQILAQLGLDADGIVARSLSALDR